MIRIGIAACMMAPLLVAQSGSPYKIKTIAGAGQRIGDNGPAVEAFLRNPQGLARDARGRVFAADSGHHRVRRIDPDGTITSIAGTGTRGVEGDDGPAIEARLWEPRAVAIAGGDALLIADGSGRIRRVSADGRIDTIIGNGKEGWTGDGGPAKEAAIGIPGGIAVDRAGNVYFSDILHSVVRKVSTDGRISTVAGTGTQGFSGDGGAGAQAQLFAPLGLAISDSGSLLIADFGNLRIRELLPGGNIRTAAGGGQGADGGRATSVFLAFPCSIASDGMGSVFVGQSDAKIRKIDPSGMITTIASAAEPAPGEAPRAKIPPNSLPCGLAADGRTALFVADGRGDTVTRINLEAVPPVAAAVAGRTSAPRPDAPLETRFLLPQGLTRGPDGDLYFADSEAHRVYRMKESGALSVVAGNGNAGFSGDGGPATAASLTAPAAVASDRSGSLWIADSLNRRIRKVTPSGEISTVASGEAPDVADRISVPVEIAADASGAVYFLELERHWVRKIDRSGKVSVLAGGSEPGYSGDGGLAVHARLNRPLGLHVDGEGRVYVADTSNGVVRRIDGSGIITTVAGGGNLAPDGAPALRSALVNPSRITTDNDGLLVFAEEATGSSASRLRRVDRDGLVWPIAGNGLAGTAGDGGLATQAALGPVRGLSTSPDGGIFVTDTGNRVIRKLSLIRAARLSVAGGDNQTAPVSRELPEALAVFAEDESGIPVPGVEVRFEVLAGSVAVIERRAITGVDGIALARVELGPEAGTVSISASADQLDGLRLTAHATPAQIAQPSDLLDYVIETIAGNATASRQEGIKFDDPVALAFTRDGVIHVADSSRSAVRSIGLDQSCTTIAGRPVDSCPGLPGAAETMIHAPYGLAAGVEGEVFVSDRARHRIYRIDGEGGVTVVAGTGVPGYSGDDGPAQMAQLDSPTAILVSRSGTIFISDTGNRRIRAITPEGTMTTVAGNGILGGGGDGNLATETSLVEPLGLAESVEGTLLVVDGGAHEVKAVSPGGLVKVIAGIGRPPTPEEARASTVTLALNFPTGVALAEDGSIYIGEKGRIRRISPGNGHSVIESKFLGDILWPAVFEGRLYVLDRDHGVLRRHESGGAFTSLAGSRLYGDGGPAADASLSMAGGLAEDGNGNLYFADTLNHVVRRIDGSGIVTTIAGTGKPGSSGDGGPALEAGVDSPAGIAIRQDGTIYISELREARIRRIAGDGRITTIAGTGRFADAGDGGPAREASFFAPAALALDAAGNLFVADSLANRVRKISPDGIIRAVAGVRSGEAGIPMAIRATETLLSGPSALAVDAGGNLYICDRLNNRILKVFQSGAVSRIAGTGQRRIGFTGGPATGTHLNRPSGVAVDPGGNLYIADESQRIFKVSPSGILETIAGRGPAGFSGDGDSARQASLREAGPILVNSRGEVIFSDRGNRRIRRLTPQGSVEAAGAR